MPQTEETVSVSLTEAELVYLTLILAQKDLLVNEEIEARLKQKLTSAMEHLPHA